MDGSLVNAHFRKGNSIARLSKMPGLKRSHPRYGRVNLDSLSKANIKRYGKPNAFGHKPRLVPVKPGMDLAAAADYRRQAEETLAAYRVVGRGSLSSTHYRSTFKRLNRARRKAQGRG